jgi:hypothetical protein
MAWYRGKVVLCALQVQVVAAAQHGATGGLVPAPGRPAIAAVDLRDQSREEQPHVLRCY